MGEIRFVGPGKARGYPYPVCKKIISRHMTESFLEALTDKRENVVKSSLFVGRYR